MEPQRTCIGCRHRDRQSAMLRLVRRGGIVVDGTSPRAPGRGAYVHDRRCLALAIRRQAIRRAFGPGTILEVGLMEEDPHRDADAPGGTPGRVAI